METVFDFSKIQVADWRMDFGLWLRQTPTQKHDKRSHLSVASYEGDIAQMCAWFAALNKTDFDPSHVNAPDLERYFAEMKCAPATHKRKLASARMFIRWAMLRQYLTEDPSACIPYRQSVRKSPRDVSDDERMMLEMAAEENESTLIGLRDSVLFYLMANAGLRISEAVNLKISEIDFEQQTITFIGKGKKERTVHLEGSLRKKINNWIARMPKSIEGTLLTDERGMSITRSQASRRFGLIAARAGVKVTPHAMRHTFVLRFMGNYIKKLGDSPDRMITALKAACQETGDTEIVMLSYYTNPRESDIRAVMEMM